MKIAIYIYIIILFFSSALFSCKKFVQIPSAPNLLINTQVFSDSADANAAVVALYVTMAGNSSSVTPFNSGINLFSSMSADELYPIRNIPDESAIYANSILSANSNIGGLWSTTYFLLYKANAIIEGLSNSPTVSVSAKNQFIGEAKMIRALCFFHLVNMYGKVPLVLTTDYKVSSVMGRTSVDSVYNQIESDLKDAGNLLGTDYPTAGRVRPNSYTASALLARVYLYRNKWSEANIESSKIINDSSAYSLSDDLNTVFLAGSNEAIWQLLSIQPGYETAEGFLFVPSSSTAKPKYAISDFLLNAFEANDQRKDKWLNFNVSAGQTFYYPYKYKLGRDNNSAPLENLMMFRVGEQYLIRAEARAQLNDLEGAASDLNRIRLRAGLPETTATTQEELLNAIYHEKQTELFCEQAHRWYDLKATNKVNDVMSIVTPAKGGSWTADKALYPIFIQEIQNNPFLTQNPGYN